MPVALITGASRGLGLAVSAALAERGWSLVTDARSAADLDDATAQVRTRSPIRAVPGDVSDPSHRADLTAAVAELGGLDLLLNNASTLGPTPMPELAALSTADLESVLATNLLAPLALTQLLLPQLRRSRGRVVNVTSDAAREPYAGWGAYGTSKAALEQLSAILAAEQPDIRVFTFDPGDMRTRMHQDAFPGEDISDRPEPAAVVPALLHLLDADLPSGRYSASDLAATGTASA
jgi:NAD(P)-dependent dehydrogenase (short-subunit alcohol dehydrogenase family)